MEHYLARSFANHLLKSNIITDVLFDVYVYGTELLLSFIITNALIIGLGFLFNRVVETIIHLTVFILIRRFTGGYHATTYLRCKIIMIVVYLCTLFFSAVASVDEFWYIILFAFGNFIIFFSAPIENPNKKLDYSDKKRFRMLSHIFFTATIIIGFVLLRVNMALGKTVFFSLLSVVALMITPILMKGEK